MFSIFTIFFDIKLKACFHTFIVEFRYCILKVKNFLEFFSYSVRNSEYVAFYLNGFVLTAQMKRFLFRHY